MVLNIIGIGLYDEKDITLRGLELIKGSSNVYLESYTSVLDCSLEELEKLYGCKVILADRDMIEKNADMLLDEASSSEISLLVVGDPVSATTHVDLVLRAREKGIEVRIVHNASVLTAVGTIGLELYKYGKTTSIVFPQENWNVQTHYDVVKQNKSLGLHTLCLLDIKVKEPSTEGLAQEGAVEALEPRFMTVAEGIRSLLSIESERKEGVFTDDTICVGCARLGSPDALIVAGTAAELLSVDFGGPLHCLIVPGTLHFVEEEMLEQWKRS